MNGYIDLKNVSYTCCRYTVGPETHLFINTETSTSNREPVQCSSGRGGKEGEMTPTEVGYLYSGKEGRQSA